MKLETFVFVGGLLHFGILIASALVPTVLEWDESLKLLDGLSREVVWVHGVFIVLVIVAFALLSVFLPHELAAGTVLARAVCGFIAVFWAARLAVQFFVFDAKPYLRNVMLRAGYHGLTLAFAFNSIVYAVAACWPR